MTLQHFKPGGIVFKCDGWREIEAHTSTCAHCQRMTEFASLRKMTDHVDICRSCMRLICLQCAGSPCVTWAKKCDIEEAIARRKLWGNLSET